VANQQELMKAPVFQSGQSAEITFSGLTDHIQSIKQISTSQPKQENSFLTYP